MTLRLKILLEKLLIKPGQFDTCPRILAKVEYLLEKKIETSFREELAEKCTSHLAEHIMTRDSLPTADAAVIHFQKSEHVPMEVVCLPVDFENIV